MNNFEIDLHIYLWSCIGITGIVSQNRTTNFCKVLRRQLLYNASQVVFKVRKEYLVMNTQISISDEKVEIHPK